MSTDASLASRFFAKVDKAGPRKPHMESECWMWTASTFRDGYGKFWMGGRNHPAQRVAWFIQTGSMPTSFACHRCDEPGCVRFSHLFDGDAAANNIDSVSKGRHPKLMGDANPMRRPGVAPAGEAHPMAKINNEIVAAIRARALVPGITQRMICKEFNLSPPTVCNIINRKSWRNT